MLSYLTIFVLEHWKRLPASERAPFKSVSIIIFSVKHKWNELYDVKEASILEKNV